MLKILFGKARLFITGFIQVFLVVANTYFIAYNNIPGIILNGFFISYVWSHNIKRIAFGNEWDRIIYSIGAMLGSIAGYFLAKSINVK